MLQVLAASLFALGLTGVIIRRNVLVMLMCMELMLNGVNLSLVTFAQQQPAILQERTDRLCACSHRLRFTVDDECDL